MADHEVVLPLVSSRVGVHALWTGAGKRGKMRLAKGKQDVFGQMAEISAAQSRLLLWEGGFWSDQGREKGTVQMFLQVLFTIAACCTSAYL